MKKFLACLLAVAMVFSLAGCGGPKEPTADELMKGIREIDADRYNDVGMTMEIASDGGELDEMSLEAGVEMAGDVMHIYDMKLNAGMEGFSITVRLEGWMDRSMDKAYMKMNVLGQDTGWEETDLGSDGSVSGLTDLTEKISGLAGNDGLVLEDRRSGEDYVVSWAVDTKAVEDVLSSAGEDYAGARISSAGASAVFDAGTKELKKMSVTCDMSVDGNDMAVDAVFTFRTVNGDKKLAVPQDVISEAGSGSSLASGMLTFGDGDTDDTFGGFGDDDLFTFGGDDPDPEPGSGRDPAPAAVSGGDNLHNEDGGSDDLLDPMAVYLGAYDPEGDVYLHHYDDYSTMAWYPSADNEWSGSIDVTHYAGTGWSDALGDYESHVTFLSGYYGMDPSYGGLEEDNALFIRETDTGLSLDYVGHSGTEVYFKATAHCYEHTSEEDLMEHLLYMLGVMGDSGL